MRVYLPVTFVYLSEYAHLTLTQIGYIGTVAALTIVAATIPGGYFADRLTRKAAMLTATILMAISTALYVVAPSFSGAILATIFSFMGYAFYSGAGEALVHDTLVALKDEDNYIRVMGRAQSFGLVGNIVLVGLIPLTYAIDKRLPFIFGTIASLLFIGVVMRMVEPPRPVRAASHRNPLLDLYKSLRRLVGRHTLILFMAIGMVSGLYIAMSSFNTLVFKDLGLSPEFLGIMFALSSALAAVGGWHLFRLRRLSLVQYAAIDVGIATGFLMIVGLSRNLPIAIIAFIINMSFWRLRKIMYQDHLLRRFSDGHNKATLISTLGFFENINAIWVPFGFVAAITALGFYNGYALVGATAMVSISIAFIMGFAALRSAPKVAVK